MPLNTSQTFECAVYPEDALLVKPMGVYVEITSDGDNQSVLLNYEQVKKLRKALKECLKSMGQTK